MRGKIYIVISVLLLIVAVGYSQGVTGVSWSFLGTGTCDTPGAGKTVLCVTTVSGVPDAQVSVNGSAMTSLKGKDGTPGKDGTNGKDGAAGVAGVAGVKGDKGDPGGQGIQGIPGPATFAKSCSMKFTGAGNPDGSLVVTFSGCQ